MMSIDLMTWPALLRVHQELQDCKYIASLSLANNHDFHALTEPPTFFFVPLRTRIERRRQMPGMSK